MADDSKKLILGLLYGLSLEQVKPFFLSLEKTGYRGDACMVVGNVGAATQQFLRARRIQLIPFQKAFLKNFPAWAVRLPRWLLSARRRPAFDHLIASTYMHPRCARYFQFQTCLQECGGGYQHVLLTDVRDVFFQSDPFGFEGLNGLGVFLQDDGRRLGATQPEGRELRQTFGPGALGMLADTPVITTGVVIGRTAAIREYLAQVTRVLSERRERRPIDRAVVNFLLHREPPARITRFKNGTGPVMNLAGMDPARLQFDPEGRVVNDAGEVVNVLHQYDRHPDLAERLLSPLSHDADSVDSRH